MNVVSLFEDAPIIHAYTRAQALADGVLVDVSERAREAGFRVPVAMTARAFDAYVAWDAKDTKRQTHQDSAGRLWDVLWMASMRVRSHPRAGEQPATRIRFGFYAVPRGGRARTPKLANLDLVSGPGDDGEHVITITMPGED